MALYKKFNGNFAEFQYAVVFDSLGKPTPVNRFWKENTAVLVFLRHFGCISCRAHAVDIWANRESLQQSGARIIFIGSGAARFIEGFREEYKLGDAEIFTDPTLKAFALGGFKHGFLPLLNPQSIANMGKLSAKGFTNSSPFKAQGSNRQMGGVIVMHPYDHCSYHYVSEALGDVPEANEIPSEDENEETKKAV
jgi:hypothetical protein